MLYIALVGGIILLLIILFFLRPSRELPQREIKPRKPKREEIARLQSPVFKREIEERKANCRLYLLASYREKSHQELTPQQQEILYQELKNFPLPSGAALKLSELLRDPYADSRQVASLAATDPVLSAKILAIVNSAYFLPSTSKRVTSIHRAILLLGFNQVRNLLLQTVLENAVAKHSPLPKEEIKKIWMHSATVSVVAGHISSLCETSTGLALTAGLVHDIGKFFLPFFEKGQAGGSYSLQESEEELPPLIQEEMKYGFNHCVIGATLCRLWKLPSEITQTVAFHHFLSLKNLPDLTPETRKTVLIVALADYICHLLGVSGEEAFLYSWPENIVEALGLSGNPEDLITPKLQKEVEKMAKMLESFYE